MLNRNMLKREVEVAFSRHAQPVWFRIVKYLLLGLVLYLYRGTSTLWLILGIVVGVGLFLHLWYRHHTKVWTRSYGAWNYEKNKPRQSETNGE